MVYSGPGQNSRTAHKATNHRRPSTKSVEFFFQADAPTVKCTCCHIVHNFLSIQSSRFTLIFHLNIYRELWPTILVVVSLREILYRRFCFSFGIVPKSRLRRLMLFVVLKLTTFNVRTRMQLNFSERRIRISEKMCTCTVKLYFVRGSAVLFFHSSTSIHLIGSLVLQHRVTRWERQWSMGLALLLSPER